MTIVLLNTTPIVQKLVEKLVQKRGDTLIDAAPEDGRRCDVVIVDDSVRDDYDAQRAKRRGDYTLFIGSRFDEMPQGFDAELPKPFLPDELSRLLDDAQMVLASQVDRADIFDADEAAEALSAASEAEPSEPESVFSDEEIDEVKQLLETFEAQMPEDEIPAVSIADADAEVSQAFDAIDASEWDRPVDEVLFETEQARSDAGPEPKASETALSRAELHARGVEALQDLMAILSDESVARALKSMGVRIDISFGEKA